MRPTLEQWSRHLATLASPPERGAVPRHPLAAWLGLADMPPSPRTPDERLWAALVDPDVDVSGLLAEAAAAPRGSIDAGSLFAQGSTPLEVWTEQDLSGLQALARLAARDADAALGERVSRVASWHLEHTQPDNATNRPWAIDVFLRRAAAGDDAARLYGETLLHNWQASAAGDPLSALVLLAAARSLVEPA